MLPVRLSQVLADEPIASVIVDGAYNSRACRDTIADRGAEPIFNVTCDWLVKKVTELMRQSIRGL